ncbi:MAG: hypothetical protein FJ009_21880, partial [Chloroflexi bacterium]|nr:hypothetical protein [Chloroflexota bacterium]
RAVEQRIKRYARSAKIARPVTPHTLRHSIAVHYLQGGAPVNFIQGLLGHASLVPCLINNPTVAVLENACFQALFERP